MSLELFDLDDIMREVRAAAGLSPPATVATLLQNRQPPRAQPKQVRYPHFYTDAEIEAAQLDAERLGYRSSRRLN
jgi:hypothetical protein